MSIWFIDNRENKQACLDAVSSYKQHGDFDKAMMELDVALDGIRVNKAMVMNHVKKLVMANNVDRALKLLNVFNDYEPRLWWRIPILLVLWPFLLVWRIIKLGLPGD